MNMGCCGNKNKKFDFKESDIDKYGDSFVIINRLP
jgi:hypothetical protein